jgi:peptidoglycan hydrolase CwlO-like protein
VRHAISALTRLARSGRDRASLKTISRLPVARLVAALAAVALVGALAVGPVAADSTQTKKELDAAIAQLHKLEDKVAAENATIDGMQKDLSDLAAQLDRVASRLATTQFKIVKKEQEIQSAQSQYDATRGLLNDRAWVAYENGPGSSLEFLLGATTLSDLADRIEIVNSAAQSDQDLIISIQEEQNRLRSRQAELESLQTSLESDQAALDKQQKDLQKKLDAEKVVQDQLAADQAAEQSIVDDLNSKYKKEKAAEAALAELLRQQQGQANGNFKLYNAFSACPVVGAGYSDDFGAPRYGGGFHPHAGNDLFAARDTPIHAPFGGTVVDASNSLGGISVEVIGGPGMVYNAHLDHIQSGVVGTTVSSGTVIGFVGNSGDAQGGATHDHFEFHPSGTWPTWKSPYGYTQIGDAVDPYPFLLYIWG